MDQFILEKLSLLLKTGIFQVKGSIIYTFGYEPEQNPLYRSLPLMKEMMQECCRIDVPYIHCDEFNIYYACIRMADSFLLAGPMPTEYLNRPRRHEYYRKMNVEPDLDKNLRLFTIEEILQTVEFLGKLILKQEYTDEELVEKNHLNPEKRKNINEEYILYSLKTEDSDEDYRHTYQEERDILEAVREGNVEKALKRNKELDGDIGKLSENDIEHWKTVLIISVTLCSRAAIEGGLSPYQAYRMSGFYINKGSSCNDILQLLSYRNQAVKELTEAVRDIKNRQHTSSYTRQCQDYVRRHFREKIYLDEIAEKMGISSSYLSRLFKKETGKNLQDYITEIRVERAANLLVYSEEPLSRIAEYVNFPSQSYFGRVFKEHMHMTPREYRENYKPSEFIENNDK